jgi:hypothetical protein
LRILNLKARLLHKLHHGKHWYPYSQCYLTSVPNLLKNFARTDCNTTQQVTWRQYVSLCGLYGGSPGVWTFSADWRLLCYCIALLNKTMDDSPIKVTAEQLGISIGWGSHYCVNAHAL